MAVAAIAGLASVGSAMVAAGTFAIGFTAAATAFAIGAGLSIVSRALMPKPDLGAAMQGLTSTVREPASSRKIVYGRTRVGGSLIFISNSGSKNEYLHMVIVYAAHEIDAYEKFYFNDKLIWDGGTFQSDWGDYVRINYYDGSQTTADSNLVNESVYWTSDHKVQGSAYIHIRLKWDSKKFPQGVPNVSAVIRGKKVYDPRTGLTQWSQNPALCLRDYVLNQNYGLGESSSRLNEASIIAAANLCEQQVALDAGGTHNRYSLDGVVDTASSIKENIESMLASMGGKIVFSGGQYFISGSSYTTPTINIDESVTVGEISVQTRQSRRGVYNGVKGVFLSEEKNYILADYPAQISSTYAVEDGDPVYLDMTLPFVTNNIRAQRLAKIALLKSRQQTLITIPVNMAGLKFKAGDFITISNAKMGWDEKPFEVLDYALQDNNGAIIVNLTCIETSSSVYDWTTSDEVDFFTEGELSLDDGTSVNAPNNLLLTETTEIGADGTVIPALLITWDEPAGSIIDYYVVEWKKSTDLDYSDIQVFLPRFTLSPIDLSSEYDVRVRAVNLFGVSSNYATEANKTLAGDTTAPAVPTSLNANGGFKQITLSWVNPLDSDFKHCEIQYNNSGTWTDLAVSSGESFVDFINSFGTSREYRIRSVDFSGNKSAYTSGVTGETDFVDTDSFTNAVNQLFEDAGLYGIEPVSSLPATGDFNGQLKYNTTDNQLYRWNAGASSWEADVFTIDDGSIDIAKFASGIEPIAIVSSLPSPTGYTGALVVYNTSDGKIYRYSSGAWTSVVSASDLTGDLSISNFPNNLRPIEIVSSLPTTGNFQGRQVFLTTDNKLYRYDGTAWTTSVSTSDLDGLITTLQIADDAVTNAKIAVDAIQGDVIAAGAITADKILNGVIGTLKLADDAVTNAKIAVDAIQGDVIAASAITSTKISDGAIETAKLAAGAITTAKLAAGAVTANEIAANTITASEIAASAITANEIAANAITTAKIAAAAVTAAEIAANTITASQIAVNTITATEIAAGTITASEIASNAITTDKLNANAVSTAKIAADAITANEIATGAVTADAISAGSVSTAALAANAITADKIASNAITTAKIAADAITSDKLAANSVTAGAISAGAVSTSELAANAVTTEKLLVRARGAALNADPNVQDSTAWVRFSQGTATFTTVTDGEVGVNVIRSSSAGSWYNGADRLALDPSKTYRMTFIARKSSTANGTLFGGVAAFRTDGSNIQGGGTQWSYDAALASSGSTSWTRYSMEFGAGTSATFPSDAASFAPLVILNYQGSAGYFEAQDIRIEEKVSADLIVDGTITASKIASSTITGDRIQANTITGGLLATSGIITNTAQIDNGLITNAKIENGAITTAKIGDLQVETAKIGNNAVTFPRFVNGSTGVNITSTSFVTIATLSNVPATGAPIQIRGGGIFTHGTGGLLYGGQYKAFDLRLYADSFLVSGVSGAIVGGYNSNSIVIEEDYTTTATRTYTLQIRIVAGSAAYCRVLNSFISFVELKK